MNKKTKSFQKFILLFLVIAISVSIPQYQAHASIWTVLGYGAEGLIEVFMSFLYSIPYVIGKLILVILVVLLYIAQWFIDILLDPLIYVGDATRPGVLTSNSVNLGWTVVRDVCNMFFMFFLLIVAFGTMLRSKSINIKAILPKIIISLFLINFSKVFAFLIIDISQFFLVEISGTWMPGGMGPSALSLTSVTDAFGNKLGPVAQVVDWAIISLDELIMVFFAVAFSSVLLLIYMMLACFLIIRLTAFAVLIVFSPVAFLGIAFPALSQYSTQWWKEITKWAIFGPVFVFFIYLATTMANDLVGVEYDDFTGKWAYLQSIVVIIVPAIVPMAILLMAPSFAKSSSKAGAGVLVGGKGGVGNIGMGAYGLGKWGVGRTKQVGGAAANRSTKVSNVIERGKDGYSSALKKAGLHKQGQKFDAKRSASKDENLKSSKIELMGTLEYREGEQETMRLNAEGKNGTHAGSAHYLMHMADTGKLKDMDPDEKSWNYERAKANYLDDNAIKILCNSDASFAEVTDKGDKRLGEIRTGTVGGGDNQITQKAHDRLNDPNLNLRSTPEEELRRETILQTKKDGKLADVSLDDETTLKVSIDVLTKSELDSMLNSKNDQELFKIQKKLAAAATSADGARDTENAAKYRGLSMNHGAKLEEVVNPHDPLAKQKIAALYPELTGKSISKMSDQEIKEHGHNASSAQARMFNREGKAEKMPFLVESYKNEAERIRTTVPEVVAVQGELDTANKNLSAMKKILKTKERELKIIVETPDKQRTTQQKTDKPILELCIENIQDTDLPDLEVEVNNKGTAAKSVSKEKLLTRAEQLGNKAESMLGGEY